MGPPTRPLYEQYVNLSNVGARDHNFTDAGALWRSGCGPDPRGEAPRGGGLRLASLRAPAAPCLSALLHTQVRAAVPGGVLGCRGRPLADGQAPVSESGEAPPQPSHLGGITSPSPWMLA